MSIEYRDGSFSEIMPFDEALKRFVEEAEAGIPVKALHTAATAQELLERIALIRGISPERSIEERLKDLEEKVKRYVDDMKMTTLIDPPEETKRRILEDAHGDDAERKIKELKKKGFL